MTYRRGITCQVSSFHIDNPPQDGFTGPHSWMAVATAHIYDPDVDTKGLLTPAAAILSGEVMRVISGKASAASEPDALSAALKALLFQLSALGFLEAETK